MPEEPYFSYSRNELAPLSETDEEKEAMALIHRFKGQIDMLAFTNTISFETSKKMYAELQVARTQAIENIHVIQNVT